MRMGPLTRSWDSLALLMRSLHTGEGGRGREGGGGRGRGGGGRKRGEREGGRGREGGGKGRRKGGEGKGEGGREGGTNGMREEGERERERDMFQGKREKRRSDMTPKHTRTFLQALDVSAGEGDPDLVNGGFLL